MPFVSLWKSPRVMPMIYYLFFIFWRLQFFCWHVIALWRIVFFWISRVEPYSIGRSEKFCIFKNRIVRKTKTSIPIFPSLSTSIRKKNRKLKNQHITVFTVLRISSIVLFFRCSPGYWEQKQSNGNQTVYKFLNYFSWTDFSLWISVICSKNCSDAWFLLKKDSIHWDVTEYRSDISYWV
jgi:hypothetical protein